MGFKEARNSNLECCGDSLKYIHLSSLPLLYTWFIIHPFCWLVTSKPQDSQRKAANHGLTEGPNLSVSMFFCLSVSLSSSPNIKGEIPLHFSSPINCEWSGEQGHIFQDGCQLLVSVSSQVSIGRHCKSGKHSLRSPHRRQKFTTGEQHSSGTMCWSWEEL